MPVRFNLLHLISDWFRNPNFRGRMLALPYAEQLSVFTGEYGLEEAEVAILVNIDRKKLAAVVGGMVKAGNADKPDDWEGVTNAVTRGDDSPPGKGPGWPGTAWHTLESVSPATVGAGASAQLTVKGWNLKAGDKVEFALGQKRVPFQFTVETDAKGRSTLTGSATLPSAGSWSLILNISGAGAGLGLKGSLEDALTAT